jgi:hypothetical protein
LTRTATSADREWRASTSSTVRVAVRGHRKKESAGILDMLGPEKVAGASSSGRIEEDET